MTPDPALTDLSDLLGAAAEAGELEEAHELISRHLGPAAAVAAQKRWTDRLEDGPASEADPGLCLGPRLLAEILKDPKALKPPETVASRLAWRGRVSLFAAREKMGKSTLLSASAAAVSRGRPFLGEPTEAGPVLLLALEEHTADVARRLVEFDADPERIFLLDRVGDPFADLEAAVRDVEPVLTAVDTLAAFTESLGLDPGSSADWTPVMNRVTRIARDSDTGLVLSHHGTKRDGKYRDSTAIGAGADAILEMSEGQESSVREVSARARWRVKDYAVRLLEGGDRPRFELTEGELSLDSRVLMYVERSPGASTREVRENVQGKAMDISTALTRLEREGALENRGAGGRNEWHPSGDVKNPGNRSGTGGGSSENPQGTATEPVSGTAPVPGSRPLEPHDGNRSEAGGDEGGPQDLQADLETMLEGDR